MKQEDTAPQVPTAYTSWRNGKLIALFNWQFKIGDVFFDPAKAVWKEIGIQQIELTKLSYGVIKWQNTWFRFFRQGGAPMAFPLNPAHEHPGEVFGFDHEGRIMECIQTTVVDAPQTTTAVAA